MTKNATAERRGSQRASTGLPTVELYHDADREEVTAFLLNHPQCHPTHLPEWRRAVVAAYRGRDVSLVARRTDRRGRPEIIGFLPCWSDPRGSRAVSAPYGTHAGLVCDQTADQEKIAEILFRRLGDELASNAIRRCVVRAVLGNNLPGGAYIDEFRSVYLLDVPRTIEDALAAASSKARNQSRKAKKLGLTLKHGHQQLPALYELYVRAMWRKGTPCHPRRLFEALLAEFGSDADVLIASTKEGRPAAGMLILQSGGTLYYPWQSSDPTQLSHCPNDFLIGILLEQATTLGLRTIDMGTSIRGSTQAHFKEKWGAREERLEIWDSVHRNGLLAGGVATKIAPVVWRWLPLSWTRVLGPLVRKRNP